MKRIAALVLSAALLLGLLSGCGGEDDPYVPTGNALSQGEITEPDDTEAEQRTVLPFYPERGRNPYLCSDYSNRVIFSLIYQGLFAVDREYQVWPVLCDSYTVSWDMKTYTFRMAEATFSDGSPLTAADAAASLEAARAGDVYGGRFGYVDTINVTEDGALEIVLSTPYENFPLLLDVPIVKGTQADTEAPLGTGPYTYDQQGDQLGLRRSPTWWCDAAIPVDAERIYLMTAESPAKLRDAFEFSDLSLVNTDPGSDSYADFHSDYELWDMENGIFLYLACNDASPVFAMPAFRKALTWSVDRSTIAETYYRDFAYTTSLPASPQSPYYNEALANGLGYDPQRMTLAVADHPEVREITVTLLVNGSDAVRVRVARSIAQSLTGSGLKTVTSELTGLEYRTALQEGAFDIHLGQTKLSANMDLTPFFAAGGTLAYGGLEDPVLQALCLESLANIGNYYTLYQKILEDGQLCPLLFRSYAIYTQRGSFSDLQPSRDNLFFYHLDKTDEDVRMEE